MKEFIPQFIGKVSNGQIVLLHPDEYSKYLKKFEGKDVNIIIEKFSANRTLRQNRRHFGALITAIAKHTGHTKEEIHDWVKAKFLRGTVEIEGKVVEIVKGSSGLNKDEFTEFMDKVERLAITDFGIVIDPKYK